MITGCITDGITGLHRISGGVGQEGGIWSICKTRQLEYYSDKKTQLKGVSLSGLRYAVFAGDEKTLTLSEKGSRSRDLQDSIVSLYRITETSLKPETVLETTPSCLTWLNEVNTVQKKKKK